MREFIPFGIPDIGECEIEEVVATLRSGWLTRGPRVEEFERRFCDHVGASKALAVNSCTAGLHLALAALGLRTGDEVITTPLTFCATVNVILQTGATPVLVDVGDDLNLSPAAVDGAITSRTRAILPVHLAGLPCSMDPLWNLASTNRLFVVEDAAHAVGASYKGVRIGAGRSDAVAFSFHPTKNMTTGEGGMVTTPRAELDDHMRLLSLHGISSDGWSRHRQDGTWYYEVLYPGYKYNMNDIQAAIGLTQLERLDMMNGRRAQIASFYNEVFQELPEFQLPPNRSDAVHAWHLYILRLNLDQLKIDRTTFINEMRNRAIGCSVHFIPISLHPYYSRALDLRHPCTRALSEYQRLLSLPISSRMTDEHVDRVVNAVKDITVKNRIRSQIPVPSHFQAANDSKTRF